MAGVGQGSDPDSLLMARTGSTLKMVRCDIQHDYLDNILQEMSSKRPSKLASGPNPFGIETPLTQRTRPAEEDDCPDREVVMSN